MSTLSQVVSVRARSCPLPQALSALPCGARAEVHALRQDVDDPALLARLATLGFVRGEPVRMLAHGPIGREPLLVQVGHTRFALRRCEADCVMVLHGAGRTWA